MSFYNTAERIPTFRQEVSLASVGSSTKILKRDSSSPEYATSPAEKLEPVVKKARTLAVAQGQRYPGSHFEVWHKSSEFVQPKKESPCGTLGRADKTAQHELTLEAPSHISLAPSFGVSTAQEEPGSATVPIYNGWSPDPANYFDQGTHARDSVCFQSCPPLATAPSLPTHCAAPSTSFSNATNLSGGQICLETPSGSVNSSQEAGLQLEPQDFSPLEQIGGVDDLLACTQLYEDPTVNLGGPTHLDLSCLPWTGPNDMIMGGGECLPASHQAESFLDPAFAFGPEEDYQQPPIYGETWHAQQSGLTPVPNCLGWTDAEVPSQPPSQQFSNDCASPSQPLRQDEVCSDEALHRDQMSHKDQSPLRPRQPQPSSSLEVAGSEEEILMVSEDSQGAAECTLKPSDQGKPEKKPPKPRKPLEGAARQQTSLTRDVGACVRCKIQRVRCIPNTEEPSGPCEACSRIALSCSRKVIHNIGCHRYILRDIVLFRTSGSKVTDRWHGAQVRNVTTQGKTFSVEMMQNFVERPFICEVRKVTNTGRGKRKDKTTREWYSGEAILHEDVLDYALADVHHTMSRYKEYIRDSVLGINCQPAINKVVKGFRDVKEGPDIAIVGDIYEKAWEYYNSLPSGSETWDFFYQPRLSRNTNTKSKSKSESSRSISDKGFLLGIFELQFAMRHATGWSWILEGAGGIPNARPCKSFPPLKTYIMSPRMMVGQIDCIRISCVLKPLAKSLLKVLTTWVSDGQLHHWMSIFFATFILLTELAKATEDAYHHGWYDKDIKRNGPKHAHIIREIHESANIILAYWHYYNCNSDPLRLSDKICRDSTPLSELTPEQFIMVQELWLGIQQWKQKPRNNESYDNTKTEGWWQTWCHSMYFADQMFENDWKPRRVFG